MAVEPNFTAIKEGFYLVEAPEIRESSWYLRRKPGKGTYAEIAPNAETGVYIAPWPFNRHIVVEEHDDPKQRRLWDESPMPKVVEMAAEEIIRRLGSIPDLGESQEQGSYQKVDDHPEQHSADQDDG